MADVLSPVLEQEQEGAGAEGISHPCPSCPGDLIPCQPFISHSLLYYTHIHIVSLVSCLLTCLL